MTYIYDFRALWLFQLENLGIEYAPILPKDTPISSLSTTSLRNIVLRAGRDHDTWTSGRPVKPVRDVLICPSFCASGDEREYQWLTQTCKLTPGGEYILLRCLHYTENRRQHDGVLVQCLHVETGDFIWQYPAKENFGVDLSQRIQAFKIYMMGSQNPDIDNLKIIVAGREGEASSWGFVENFYTLPRTH